MTEPGGAVPSWDRSACHAGLRISRDGSRVTQVLPSLAAWLGVQGRPALRDGVFEWDYRVRVLHRQLAVGLLVEPFDWGFFGYLGAGVNAWAYDPFEGALVTETEAVHSGLPRLRWAGVVSVRLELGAAACAFTMSVGGRPLPTVALPAGAAVLPAASLLRWGQSVRIESFRARGAS